MGSKAQEREIVCETIELCGHFVRNAEFMIGEIENLLSIPMSNDRPYWEAQLQYWQDIREKRQNKLQAALQLLAIMDEAEAAEKVPGI